jgi:hypothetical protein
MSDPIFQAVCRERQRQDSKWGEQNHPDALWLAILAEEFGEAAKEANETHFRAKAPDELVKELIQCMAVCKAWMECIERREQCSSR